VSANALADSSAAKVNAGRVFRAATCAARQVAFLLDLLDHFETPTISLTGRKLVETFPVFRICGAMRPVSANIPTVSRDGRRPGTADGWAEMQAMEAHHIPTEVYLGFLGRTIPVHWDYHAILMVSVWFVLVPICIITIRFGKPKPTLNGIREKVSIKNAVWWWFSVHKYGLILAVGLALAGAVVAVTADSGFSGSLHSFFGLTTVALGCLQIMGGWLRGKHGGKNYHTADPNDPATWFGDHYNMTPRRRKFEAYHKTAGYFIYFFAAGAVATGLMQHPIPGLAEFIFATVLIAFLLAVVLEYKGFRYDGYRAAHGYTRDAPFNKEREFL
jgi:hypothetical protein